MDEEEKCTVRSLLKSTASCDNKLDTNDTSLSFAERPLKRQRLQQTTDSAIRQYYISSPDVKFERLFSLSKRIFSEKRRSLHPRALEMGFLKKNRMLWNLALVALCVNDLEAQEDMSESYEEDDDDEE